MNRIRISGYKLFGKFIYSENFGDLRTFKKKVKKKQKLVI